MSDNNTSKNPTAAWSIEDKKKLLLALRKHGTQDPSRLLLSFPNRSLSELREVFLYYSNLAEKKLNSEQQCDQIDDDDEDGEENAPISEWIRILQGLNDKNPGITDIVPRVLRYIALFEKRFGDNPVDFKECYMILAQICDGNKPLNKNKSTGPAARFLFQNLTRLANILKHNSYDQQAEFLRDNAVNSSTSTQTIKTVKTYNGRKKTISLQNNPTLNPLKIPNNLLLARQFDEI